MIPDGHSGFVPDPRITEYPGTMIRDWIMLCPTIPDSAYRAYSIIRAHIWEKDVKREVLLTQAQIGEMLGKSTERTRKILKPLLEVGLLAVAEKREWWEHNPKLNRRERRTMNIYAVMDFPPAGYEGPKSVSDFKARFAGQATPHRSKTTGRGVSDVPAGQTDRTETTGGSSPQVSDVPAGQTDRSKMTTPEVKNDRPYKNSFQGEGEEGDARARVTGEPSAGDEPQWGVSGGAGFAAPTLASANLIREIAGRALLPGEHLNPEDHQRLAALVEAVRPVVESQKGLSWDEYVAWLKQGWVRRDGRRAFTDLPGALAWRLQPEQVQGKAWGWACEQRGAQEASEAHGNRDMPGAGARQHTSTCGRHRTQLTDEGRCLRCDAEADAPPSALAPDQPQPEFATEDQEELEEISPEEFAAMSEASLAKPKASRAELLAATRAKIVEGSEKAKAGKSS